MDYRRNISVALVLGLLLGISCAGEEKDGMGKDTKPGSKPEAKVLQLVMMGPPGAGKGTQAKKIGEKYGIPHISTGAILRAEVEKGTELGGTVKAIMERGDLVDDEIVLGLVEARLLEPDCGRGFILDGFPRTIDQARGLDAILEKRGTPGVTVIDLAVPQEELIGRMLARKRTDDTEATIRNRIEVYHEKTAPLIRYYEERKMLVHINGDQPIAQVFIEIDSVLTTMR